MLLTVVTPLTLVIAGDEHGESEGFIYMDDGITYAYEKGEFIHRKFTLKGGVLTASKVDPFEGKPPAFLVDCLIVNLTIYQVKADGTVNVTQVTGLDLKLADEWSYNLNGQKQELSHVKMSVVPVGVIVGICVAAVTLFAIVLLVHRSAKKESAVDPGALIDAEVTRYVASPSK
jgi:hypothetical protein